MKEKPAGILTEDDNVLGYEEEGDIELPPYESNADRLGGKPASDFVKLSDIDGIVTASIDVTYNGGGN